MSIGEQVKDAGIKDWIVAPGAPLSGRLRVPGDKSVSHRAIMLASLAGALRARDLTVFPSQTNVLLVKFAEPGDEARVARIDAALIDAGVVLRPMGGYGLGHCLRITVGNADENRRLLAELDKVLA